MLRRFSSRATASTSVKKRYQLTVLDGVNTVLYRQAVGGDKVGMWIAVGPVDIQRRDATYDSNTTCDFSARGRWNNSAATTCVFSSQPPLRMQKLLDAIQPPPSLHYSPYFTDIGNLPSHGLGCCVNVAGCVVSPPVVEANGDVHVTLCDKDGSGVEVAMPKPRAFDEDDAYYLDGEPLRMGETEVSTGTVLILLDVLCDASLSKDGVKLQLRVTPSSRLRVGTISSSIRERVTPPIEHYASVSAHLTIEQVFAAMPSVQTLRSTEKNVHVNVVGTIKGVTSYQPGYTKARCVSDFTHPIDERGDGELHCMVCSPANEQGTDISEAHTHTHTQACIIPHNHAAPVVKFDVTTTFEETPRDVRWCDAAAATLLSQQAGEFAKLPNAEKEEAVNSLVGRVVVMRVWCKPSHGGGMMLVMDGCLLPEGMVYRVGEQPDDEDGDEQRPNKRHRGTEDQPSNNMLMAL
jgi:hypothetical protein